MSLPQNVIWFEVFMYSSLALDSLLVAFPGPHAGPGHDAGRDQHRRYNGGRGSSC